MHPKLKSVCLSVVCLSIYLSVCVSVVDLVQKSRFGGFRTKKVSFFPNPLPCPPLFWLRNTKTRFNWGRVRVCHACYISLKCLAVTLLTCCIVFQSEKNDPILELCRASLLQKENGLQDRGSDYFVISICRETGVGVGIGNHNVNTNFNHRNGHVGIGYKWTIGRRRRRELGTNEGITQAVMIH